MFSHFPGAFFTFTFIVTSRKIATLYARDSDGIRLK